MSHLNVTTLNEHIYRGGRPKGRVQDELGFKWTANEGKEPKSRQSTKGESDSLSYRFQCTTINL